MIHCQNLNHPRNSFAELTLLLAQQLAQQEQLSWVEVLMSHHHWNPHQKNYLLVA